MDNELVTVAVVMYRYNEQDYVFVPELVPFYQNNLGAKDGRSIPAGVNDEERLKQAIRYATWPLNPENQSDPTTSHMDQARQEVERRYAEMHQRQEPKPIVLPYSITKDWINTYVRCNGNEGITDYKCKTLHCTIRNYKPSIWEKFFPSFTIALSILATTAVVVQLLLSAAASLELLILITLGTVVGLWIQNYDDFEGKMKKISRDLERYYRGQYQHWGNFSLFRTCMSFLAALITCSTAHYNGKAAFEGAWEALISVRDVVRHVPRWAAWLLSPMTISAVAALVGVVSAVGTAISVLYLVTGSWFGWGVRDPLYVLGADTLPPADWTRDPGPLFGPLSNAPPEYTPLKTVGTGANIGKAPSTPIQAGKPTELEPGYQVMANTAGEGLESERERLLVG